jgi:hypothetical protein
MKIVTAGSLPRRFEGAVDGPASISMILDETEPGGGPRLHHHPYRHARDVYASAVVTRQSAAANRAAAKTMKMPASMA